MGRFNVFGLIMKKFDISYATMVASLGLVIITIAVIIFNSGFSFLSYFLFFLVAFFFFLFLIRGEHASELEEGELNFEDISEVLGKTKKSLEGLKRIVTNKETTEGSGEVKKNADTGIKSKD